MRALAEERQERERECAIWQGRVKEMEEGWQGEKEARERVGETWKGRLKDMEEGWKEAIEQIARLEDALAQRGGAARGGAANIQGEQEETALLPPLKDPLALKQPAHQQPATERGGGDCVLPKSHS